MIPEKISIRFPKSILVKFQSKKVEKLITATKILVVTIRYDDECGNGHNSFGITGDVRDGRNWHEGGCIHETIMKHMPHFIPYIKWHLCSSDGPMHYLKNTLYHISNRGHNGLLKDEKRISKDRDGNPCWHIPYFNSRVWQHEKPAPIEWEPYYNIGEGKERDLDAARHCAIWPEATDEELLAPTEELKIKLLHRLPALMWQFKQAMEELGFIY